MIDSFTAIDFETANAKRWSVCQVGIVKVERSKIVHKESLLIQPPGNEYSPMNISIHRIEPGMTRSKPTFDKIWKQISVFIDNQHVVAHNGFSVDFHCINQSLEYYGMPVPNYHKHCTYKLFGRKLPDLCYQYGIDLKHHDALSDAMACAKLFLIHQQGKRF